MTRRRLITLGAVGLGVVIGGDRYQEARPGGVALARGRAAISPANTVPAPRRSRAPRPPARTPLPRRKEAVYRVHDVLPEAPPNAIALTIDDGPHPEWTPKVLDLLAEHEVTATFSVIGVQVKQYPKLVRRIAEAGHRLSNHTMHHPLGIASMSTRRVAAEITEAHLRIWDAAGVAPKFFRSPGGAWSRTVLGEAARHGLLPIDWDVDPRDWARPGTGHIRRAMLKARGGDILLCHDGGGDRSETVRALRQVIPGLKARGLRFVAL